MRNLLAILMVVSAAACHAMNQDAQKKLDEEKKSIEADTQKPQALKTYKEQHDDHDDWHEFDENTESLSPRKLSRFRTKPSASQSIPVHHYNIVQNLKENPDAFSYDSDEMPEIIGRLEKSNHAKN